MLIFDTVFARALYVCEHRWRLVTFGVGVLVGARMRSIQSVSNPRYRLVCDSKHAPADNAIFASIRKYGRPAVSDTGNATDSNLILA